MMSGRQLFREKAIQHFRQSRGRDILPRIVAPRIFLFLWILLGLLLALVTLTWLGRVPINVEGSGVVLEQRTAVSGDDGGDADVFLQIDASSKVRAGQLVQTQVASRAFSNAVVVRVKPGVISPDEIKRRYSQTVAGPTVIVVIAFTPALLTQQYAGTEIHARIQVGTRRLLSLFPVVGQWIGA
ncbi:MAG TPA: hypothetical protein VFV38_20345 [Ktedonobacteraceae bacterium]|nr:hypothetical protein [Ktedonobacteraceae bacterium]